MSLEKEEKLMDEFHKLGIPLGIYDNLPMVVLTALLGVVKRLEKLSKQVEVLQNCMGAKDVDS